MTIARRTLLMTALGAGSAIAVGRQFAAAAPAFAEWLEKFRARARARGISDATYTAVMGAVAPDRSVYAQVRNQPEFHEPIWKYLNRRVSAWRVMFGKQMAATHAALFDRIEAEYGVDRFVMLGIWEFSL